MTVLAVLVVWALLSVSTVAVLALLFAGSRRWEQRARAAAAATAAWDAQARGTAAAPLPLAG